MSTAPARADVLGTLRRNPAFARVYVAQLVSFAGDWFNVVALQGLVIDHTHSPFLAALMFTTQMLPMTAMSLIAGVVVDRIDRRAVMIAADLVRAGLACTFLLADSSATLWIAFAAQGTISAVTAFFEPASSAAIPNLVDERDLPTAMTLIGSAWGTMLAVGAALGGLVAATLGRDAAFLGDAASFVASALLLLSVRMPFHADDLRERARSSIVADLRELFSFARSEPRVSSLLLVKAGFGFTAGIIGLLGVMALDVFDAGDTGTGILMSGRGIGALVGPFLFRRVFGTSDRGLFRGIALSFTVFGVGYIFLGVAPTLMLAAIGALVAHVGGGAQWTLSSIGLQRFSPDRIRGRVFGADYMLLTMSLGLSTLLAGTLADRFGPRAIAVGFSCAAVAWSATWTIATRARWPRR